MRSGDCGDLARELGQLLFVRGVELIHEERCEADPGDVELGQTRERGSADGNDVDRGFDTTDELADQLVVGESYREHAIGPGLKVESRATYGILKQVARVAFEAQHVDSRVQNDGDA